MRQKGNYCTEFVFVCVCVPALQAPTLVYAIHAQHQQLPNHSYKAFNLQNLLKTLFDSYGDTSLFHGHWQSLLVTDPKIGDNLIALLVS